MSVLRIPETLCLRVTEHIRRPGEHFAFMRARYTTSGGEPVLWVTDVDLIADRDVSFSGGGHEVPLDAVVTAINQAVKEGTSLIEVHNHGGQRPRWSALDRRGLLEIVPYMLSSLPGRPYAATVWAGDEVFGEWFWGEGRGQLRSVVVHGERLRQLVSRDGMLSPEPALVRQEPWFTKRGQQQLQLLRVAIIGNGGTGSPLIQDLLYMGFRDFVLIDPDVADETSLNRLVTASPGDVGELKTALASRLICEVAPEAHVRCISDDMRSQHALDAIRGCDLIFGCVDNDGARLVLNEISLAYRIPYIDLAVGIEAIDGTVSQAGGRVAVVLPDGPCLNCMGEINLNEARYFLASSEERAAARRMGYVRGMDAPAPSVASVTATVAGLAATETAVWCTGVRPVNPFTELDLIGTGRALRAQWVTPRRVTRNADCVSCTLSGVGDYASFDRYIVGRDANGKGPDRPLQIGLSK